MYRVPLLMKNVARNGVQPTKQNAWGDWCNVIGTGFGVRPTTNTGNTLEDAFVWVKPGGECDVGFHDFYSHGIRLTSPGYF
jgi:cellulase/cellobiase CelA1